MAVKIIFTRQQSTKETGEWLDSYNSQHFLTNLVNPHPQCWEGYPCHQQVSEKRKQLIFRTTWRSSVLCLQQRRFNPFWWRAKIGRDDFSGICNRDSVGKWAGTQEAEHQRGFWKTPVFKWRFVSHEVGQWEL